MGIYDQLQTISTHSPTPKVTPKLKEKRPAEVKKETKNNQSTRQSTDQSTNRPTDKPIDQSTNPLINVDELGPVVEKPKAFYITQKVDHWLDEAVRYMQEKGLYKLDRSILVNALLHNPELFKPQSLDALRSQLLAHLTNKSLRECFLKGRVRWENG